MPTRRHVLRGRGRPPAPGLSHESGRGEPILELRRRPGAVTVGQVGGTFVTGRPPATEPGFGNIVGIYQQPGLVEAEEKNQHG